ncbi:MAG: YqgE/AlgH family protein [Bacteroidota bacterium]
MITSSYRPAPGRFLISEPFMADQNFQRTVVFLVEHNEQGSLGFVLNRQISSKIHEVVDDVLPHESPVFIGGPVEPNTLHFIHQFPEVPGSKEVFEGVFFGGDFDVLRQGMNTGNYTADQLLFFVGYSGWGAGQLEGELERKSWIVAPEGFEYIFRKDYESLWQDILRGMGHKYRVVSNYPMDPRLN